jgi:competence protein ComEC
MRSVAVNLAFACAVAAVLVVGTGVRADARNSPALIEAMGSGDAVVVHGLVTGEPRGTTPDPFTAQLRWNVDITTTTIDGHRAAVPLRIVADDLAGFELGVPVTVEGSLRESLTPRESAVMWDARVLAVGERGGGAASGVALAIHEARARFGALVEPYPERVEGLVAGMVVGDDSAMPTAQRDEMRRSGLAHLTAVSGAHFAVLTVVVIWLVRRARIPRAVQALLVAGVASAFTLLVGPEPSVLRAAAMAAVMALALALGRRARALAALAAGVIALLAIDPWVATSLGFCLSITAVAAIAVWSPHLALRLERWIVPKAARIVAVPLAAGAATAPLLVPVAQGIGAYVVPANIVAAPFAAPVTVIGLLAVIAAPVAPAVAQALVSIAAVLVRPVDLVARAFAHAPGSWLMWPDSAWGVLALSAIVALLVAASVARRVRGWGLAAVTVACSVAVVAPTVLGIARTPRLPDWDVVACDVGQGDMLLLRTATDSAVVVDVGRPSGASAECLARHGVRSVDLLVLTHPDSDHDGDTAALLSAVRVKQAWVSPVASTAASTALLARHGVPVSLASEGTGATHGPVTIRVLAPPPSVSGASDNDASIVLMADAGGTTVLALGDLELEGQERLIRSLPSHVVVDVVKIAHHGSASQSPELAERLQARVGILSVGADNRYGHPTPAAIALYEPRVGVLLRTDMCGDILVASGERLAVASRCLADVAG